MSDVYDKIVLAKATGAGNSEDFSVLDTAINICLYPEAALLDAENFNLMIKDPDDTYVEVFDSAGQVQLNGLNPQITIIGPGTYRLEAAARTTATGAFIKA